MTRFLCFLCTLGCVNVLSFANCPISDSISGAPSNPAGVTTSVRPPEQGSPWRVVTPFSRRPVGTDGKPIPTQSTEPGHVLRVRPNGDYRRCAVTFTAGINPISRYNSYTNPIVRNTSSNGRYENPQIERNAGAYTLGFSCDIRQWLEFNMALGLSYNQGSIYSTLGGGNTYVTDFQDFIFLAIPSVRVNWLRAGTRLSLYSRAGIGFAMCNRTEQIGVNDEVRSKAGLAWQLTPIGIEMSVTRQIGFFAEYGWGNIGQFTVGVKYKIKSGKRERWELRY